MNLRTACWRARPHRLKRSHSPRRQPFRNDKKSARKKIPKPDQRKRGTRRTQGEHTRATQGRQQHNTSTRGRQGQHKFSMVFNCRRRPAVSGGRDGGTARTLPRESIASHPPGGAGSATTSSPTSTSHPGHEPVPHNFVTPRRPPPTLDIYVRPFPSQEIKIEHRTREAQGDHRKESCK
jgi:hypothetical protein